MTEKKLGKGPKISVITLGCSKNTVDSEQLLGQLKVGSVDIVDNVEDAEIAVINTCGFIDAAKQESIDAIVEAVERKKGGKLKKVVVMGCLSERYRNELKADIPEVDAYFGSHELHNVVAELGVDYRKELLGERMLTTPRHFAYLKISEGCDRPCSFCAIPLMRGSHVTRPLERVAEEAGFLARKGVKELILIGQDTTYYGLDRYGERRLAGLLSTLSKVDGLEWIRLMYAYPSGFPLEVLDVMKDSPTICKYIDLPLQHASDRVLRSMRRGITYAATQSLLESIRTRMPSMAVRTTFIIGYPEETEEDFRFLCDFVQETKFHRVGVFPYSSEDGTAAKSLGDPVPEEVKQERIGILMELQRQISQERNEDLVGSTMRVLIDRKDESHAVGRTEYDAPEIDQEVYIQDDGTLEIGNFYSVEIVDALEYDLYANVVSPVPQ